MPKPEETTLTEMFPKTSDPLVNQNAGGAKDPKLPSLGDLTKELIDLRQVNADLTKKLAHKSGDSLRRQIFIQIINGMAANGIMSPRAESSQDGERRIEQMVTHSIGLTDKFYNAAKEANIG